jgi:hypothetical protein
MVYHLEDPYFLPLALVVKFEVALFQIRHRDAVGVLHDHADFD